MPTKQGSGKKSRTHKVSRGVHGGGGKVSPPLTRLQLALLGKGPSMAAASRMARSIGGGNKRG